MKDFVYSSSFIGGLAVLLYPAGVLYGDPLVITFPMIRTLTVHFLLVFLPLYMMKPVISVLKRVVGKMFFMASSSSRLALFETFFVDKTANNMFLMENPFLEGRFLFSIFT
jgi:hypothetical protein